MVISPVCTEARDLDIFPATASTSPSGLCASMAASPCGTVLLGTTATCFTVTSLAWFAARMMFLLFGRMMTLSVGRFSNAAKISCVDGFIVCPPSTMAATPKLAKMRLSPLPGETTTTAICPGSTGDNSIFSFFDFWISFICASKFSIATLEMVPSPMM